MTHASHAPAKATLMDEDEELDRAMLSLSPTKQYLQSLMKWSSCSLTVQLLPAAVTPSLSSQQDISSVTPLQKTLSIYNCLSKHVSSFSPSLSII